jgi:aminoglycoside 3-N-acetyltransferase
MYRVGTSKQEFGAPARGAWTEDALCEHLAGRCAVKPGDVLIVHSSMKSVGRVEGGPEAVVRALQRAATEAGTILMPVFSAPAPDGIWRQAQTPSRTGLITETFRRMPGVMRSLHPTHSVAAWGRRAADFVAGHDRTSGLGVGSPFHKAAAAGADVIMIGCRIVSCSLIHVAEAILRVPYLGKVWYEGYGRTLTVIDGRGVRTECPPADVPTDSAGFTVVEEEMARRGMLGRCRLGAAECIKFRAQACLDIAVELLRQDAAALLCRSPRCPVCPRARQVIAESGRRHMERRP